MPRRRKINTPTVVLPLVGAHLVVIERPFLVSKITADKNSQTRVSRRLMRHLIGAGLVQPNRHVAIGGSWVYRLTPMGEKL